jgi:hypothetical protein
MHVSLHLRTETDPVSEKSCFSSNYLESGRWTKSENPVILCVIHHRQNPIESRTPVFERAKTVHALGRAATLIGMLHH